MTIATFTTTMGNQEGIDNINGAFDKTIGHIHDGTDMNGGIISYNSLKDKPTNMATADKLRTPRTINGVPFDGSADIAIDVSAASAMVGTVDNIVNGMEVTALTGLQAVIGTGRVIIDETVVNFTNPLTIALEARMASLVYAKLDKTIGKVDAKYPIDMIDNNTVGFWVLNKTGNIPNLALGKSSIAVANDLVPSGTLAVVDGHCDFAIKGDGSTGVLTSVNSTGFPTVASERRINALITANNDSVRRYLFMYGTASGYFGLEINASNNLQVLYAAGAVDTGFSVTNNSLYLVSLSYNGTTVKLLVNGVLVYSLVVALSTGAGNLYVLDYASGEFKSKSTIHYIELLNKEGASSQIAQISNDLLLPCTYIDGVTKDIRSILPENSISLGYTKTSSTAVAEIDSESYKYGVRQGAVNGNRKAFLGWKYFSGEATLKWDNPFGTRKIKTYYTWAQDVNGKNERATISRFDSSGGAYGVENFADISNPTTIRALGGGVLTVNNTWQTTGYIGCYAEVIE